MLGALIMAVGFAVYLGLALLHKPRRWVFAAVTPPVLIAIAFVAAFTELAIAGEPLAGDLPRLVGLAGLCGSVLVWQQLGLNSASLIGKAVVDMRARTSIVHASMIGFCCFVVLSQVASAARRAPPGTFLGDPIDGTRNGLRAGEIVAVVSQAAVYGVVLVMVTRVWRARLSRPDVLLLRSFQTDRSGRRPDEVISGLSSAIGRFNGLAEPADEDYSRFGIRSFRQDSSWKHGVQPLLDRAKLIIIDVTVLTPGVTWELQRVRSLADDKRTPLLVIADEAANVSPEVSVDLRYGTPPHARFAGAMAEWLASRFPKRADKISAQTDRLLGQVG